MKRVRPPTGNPVGRPKSSEYKGESFYLHKVIRERITQYCKETGKNKSEFATERFNDYFGI